MIYHEAAKLILTTKEAQHILKRIKAPKGKKVYFGVRVNTELPIPEKDGRCFPGMAIVELSRKQAIKLAGDLLGEVLEGRGGRLRLEVHISDYGVYVYL